MKLSKSLGGNGARPTDNNGVPASSRPLRNLLSLGVALAVGTAFTAPVLAQQSTNADQPIDEVVTIGTRVQGRTAIDTAVPVDFFSQKELQSVLSPDVSDIVSKLVPSFNIAANAINEGASHIRNFTLRGLVGDKSLVLVNGKRRHRSALVFLAGWGGHGPDLTPIPTIALRSIEVLRDGASALYGSDAIAGVINFNLKDASSGGAIEVMGGQYAHFEHEGNYSVAVNKGLPLGDSGFLNLSLEWAKRDRADRGGLYDFPIAQSGLLPSQAVNTVMQNAVSVDGIPLGTRYGPDALTERDFNHDGVIDDLIVGSDGIPDDPDTRFKDNLTFPEQAWGATPYESDKFFFNSGYNLANGAQVYAFGNYMKKNSSSSFFYRSPSASQLKPVRLPDGSIYNPRTLYPGGFTPRFFGEVIDRSLTGGVKGQFGGGLRYDVSARYGYSSIAYTVKGSMNPSMGPNTATNFHPGELVNYERAVNADFSRDLGVGWSANPLTLSFGFQYMDEGYQVKQGGANSYRAGPYALPDPWNFEITQAEVDASPTDAFTQIECRIPGLESAGSLCPAGDPINNAVAVGSNGFPGYAPDFTSDYDRPSKAGYVSAESELTDKAFLSLAARYEDYSDFGSNFSWRMAGRYAITENSAFRGSFGTGFRAPTPGQISTTNVSTNVNGGALVARGIFPATSGPAKIFGAQPLEPELSKGYSLGFVTQPANGLTLTLDYYFTRIDNRLTLSSQFTPTPAQAAQLSNLGIAGANTIQQVQFFTNDADTETSGFDLVTEYTKSWASGASTTFSLSGNANNTKIVNRPVRADGFMFIDDSTKYNREHSIEYRTITSIRHQWDAFAVEARVNTYGPHTGTNSSMTTFQTFGTVNQVDLMFDWNVNSHYRLSLGGRNVFEEYPDKARIFACCGQIYDLGTVADWFGAFYYLRFTATY